MAARVSDSPDDTIISKKIKVSSQISQKTPSKEPKTMDELLAQTGYLVRGLRRGDEITGMIVAIRPGEIAIDIDGKSEGIVTGRELEYLGAVVRDLVVGKTVTATVVYPENDQGMTVLSLRKLSNDKRWMELTQAQERDQPLMVSVLDINRGGLVVDAQGVRGFIPSSQLIPQTGKLSDLIGTKLTVKIVEIDRRGNRLVLSQRQAYAQEIAQAVKEKMSQFKIGERYTGTVTSIVPFGIFVLINGIEGLVHISEINWGKITDPQAYFKGGQEQEVIVIGTNPDAGKLHLSIKQLTPDPWIRISKDHTIGTKVVGKVIQKTNFGVFVELEPGVEGLISSTFVHPDELSIGQTVSCTVESVQAPKRRLLLKPVSGYRRTHTTPAAQAG